MNDTDKAVLSFLDAITKKIDASSGEGRQLSMVEAFRAVYETPLKKYVKSVEFKGTAKKKCRQGKSR